MFENNIKKTKLMIVCDDNCMEYANYLIGLLGQNDDKPEQIIGTKDGTVDAGIYTVEAYRANLPKLSSDQHLLFIGDYKEAKSVAQNVNIKFNRYGMCYGWLGKRAVMYVDSKPLKNKEYAEFITFAQKYQQKIEEFTTSIISEALKGTLAGIFWPISIPVIGWQMLSGNSSSTNKRIKEQQYRCLTMVLYLDGLRKFLEE